MIARGDDGLNRADGIFSVGSATVNLKSIWWIRPINHPKVRKHDAKDHRAPICLSSSAAKGSKSEHAKDLSRV